MKRRGENAARLSACIAAGGIVVGVAFAQPPARERGTRRPPRAARPARAPRGGAATREPARMRVPLTVHLVRDDFSPGWPAGETREIASRNVRAVVDDAARVFASCGISIELAETAFHDAPPPRLVAVSDVEGLPSAAPSVARVAVDHQLVSASVPQGSTPSETGRLLALALGARGIAATATTLPRSPRGFLQSADVFLTAPHVFTLIAPLPSSDVRQRLRLGVVDLADGLDTMADGTYASGTLEERALVRGVTDGLDTTLDVVVVSRFTDERRLGEAFVRADHGPLAGTVVLGALGLAGSPTTDTLAHEVGHVLLDDAEHPTGDPAALATRVMAAATSPLEDGVRRTFTREECETMRQRGSDYARR